MSISDIVLRLLLSIVVGALIGWERERADRPAGFRTHILVCMGSAVVMLTGIYLREIYSNQSMTLDPTRMAAQVISGIGFLCAGTIMREGLTVKGLTTAAGLWTVACLGLAAGAGWYTGAIAGTIIAMLTLTIFEKIEQMRVGGKQSRAFISIVCKDVGKTVIEAEKKLGKKWVYLNDISIHHGEDGDFEIEAKLKSSAKGSKIHFNEICASLLEIDGIVSAKISEY